MAKKKNNQNEILKQIEAGKFQDCYLVYNRKSMDEAESQKNSIEYQVQEIEKFVDKEALKIAPISLQNFCANGVISERHSGFKEDDAVFFSDDGKVQYRIDRPKFLQLLQYLNAGHFKGVVCLCWDRLSRNKGDDAVIRKLRRRGIDTRFAFASYENTSSGELHMDVDGMFAQHHSRVTSEKVIAAMQKNRKMGLCTHPAPIGYLNTGSVEHKPIDPERGPIISEMFRLYATGSWSISDLARYANEQGMTTVPRRKQRTNDELLADEQVIKEKISRPIRKSLVSKILVNPFYAGKTLNDQRRYVKSKSHEPLVDEETFNHVQSLLGTKKTSIHYTDKLGHPMRGMLRCADCERVYTPYTKKGILYFYVRCSDGCPNEKKNFNFDYINDVIKGFIEDIHYTDEEHEKLEAQTSTDVALLEEKRLLETERLERERKRVRKELAYLRANRLSLLQTGVYQPEEYAEEITKLEDEFDDLLQDDVISEQAMREVIKDIITLSELLKLTVSLYENAEPDAKETIARKIFSELYVSKNTLRYELNRGFSALELPIVSNCAASGSLSELYAQRDQIKSSVAALQMIIGKA